MKFRRRYIPWSGERHGAGPSLSGLEAIAHGLWPEPWILAWLRGARLGVGRVTRSRLWYLVAADEEHHYRDARGQVALVGYYSPLEVLRAFREDQREAEETKQRR